MMELLLENYPLDKTTGLLEDNIVDGPKGLFFIFMNHYYFKINWMKTSVLHGSGSGDGSPE